METIQSLLTLAIEVTTVIGLGGISVHAIWTSHQRFMSEFCPAIKPYTPDTQAGETKVDKPLESPDIPAESEQPQPEQALPEQALPVQPQLDLDAMDTYKLREVCAELGIVWKNFRGKNKHMKVETMRFQIRQKVRLTA